MGKANPKKGPPHVVKAISAPVTAVHNAGRAAEKEFLGGKLIETLRLYSLEMEFP